MLRVILCFLIFASSVHAMPDFMGEAVVRPVSQSVFVEAKEMPKEVMPSVPLEESYILGTGDQIRLTVFGEEELSGAFEVDGTGHISLPLIGQVRAGGQGILSFEKQVTNAYADGYLVAPEVRVEVMNFRPFYIVGEVNNAGQYPYMSGLTVLNAVAIAGGYTPHARKKKIHITRAENGTEHLLVVGEKELIQPGDLIEVKERLF